MRAGGAWRRARDGPRAPHPPRWTVVCWPGPITDRLAARSKVRCPRHGKPLCCRQYAKPTVGPRIGNDSLASPSFCLAQLGRRWRRGPDGRRLARCVRGEVSRAHTTVGEQIVLWRIRSWARSPVGRRRLVHRHRRHRRHAPPLKPSRSRGHLKKCGKCGRTQSTWAGFGRLQRVVSGHPRSQRRCKRARRHKARRPGAVRRTLREGAERRAAKCLPWQQAQWIACRVVRLRQRFPPGTGCRTHLARPYATPTGRGGHCGGCWRGRP